MILLKLIFIQIHESSFVILSLISQDYRQLYSIISVYFFLSFSIFSLIQYFFIYILDFSLYLFGSVLGYGTLFFFSTWNFSLSISLFFSRYHLDALFHSLFLSLFISFFIFSLSLLFFSLYLSFYTNLFLLYSRFLQLYRISRSYLSYCMSLTLWISFSIFYFFSIFESLSVYLPYFYSYLDFFLFLYVSLHFCFFSINLCIRKTIFLFRCTSLEKSCLIADYWPILQMILLFIDSCLMSV